MLGALKGYFPAVIVNYVLAVTLGTLGIMSTIAGFGVPVSATDRMAAVWHDLMGMAPTYLPLIAVALAIAFLIAGQLVRLFKLPRSAVYTLAGFVAIIALHTIMEMALGLVGVAAARSVTGLVGQAIAGAGAGWVFAAIYHPRLH